MIISDKQILQLLSIAEGMCFDSFQKDELEECNIIGALIKEIIDQQSQELKEI